MAESIRFDFLSTGADKLARDFKNTGDNAAAAARGARVLQDVIDKLGTKENRTAAESRLLASALKQTGDAEDRAAAKALNAEIAISRLDEALQKEERNALEAAAANRALGDSFDRLAEKAGGPSLRGALAALSPALIPVTGGIAAGVGAIGASFGAAAIGAGLFAAAASSVLGSASDNLKKLQTLELKANTARTAAQKKAAEQQIAALKATWSKGYLAMLDALDGFKTKWTEVSQAIAVPALTAGLSALVDGLDFLKPAVIPVAAVFTQWGQAIDRYFTSQKGSAEITRLATAFGRFSASQLRDVGVFVTDIGRGVFNLGRDLAGHNIDFGTFGKHLDEWGAAFLRWSQSASARQDVNRFLAYIGSNGPVVAGLLKNLGADLKVFAPGLSSLGQLELKLVSDFLGFLARTPKFIAQPLIETAGALLLLQKTGVLSIGIKIVGAAAKWLSGGAIDIGGGAAAAAEIRAAFTSGGAAAAAEIRAALAGAAAPGAAGAAGAGGAAAGGLSGAFAAAGLVAAGVFAGAFIKALGDKLSPKGTFAGNLNHNLQQLGGPASTSLLHSFTFGGLESWMADKFGIPVGRAINNVLTFLGGHTRATTAQAAGDVSHMADVWQDKTGIIQARTEQAMAAAGRASDNLRTRNLTPLQDKVGDVTGGIQGLQHQINLLHGKNISVGAHLSGSGGVQVTPSTGAPGAKNYAVYFKPLAAGGRVFGGTEGRDSVPAMLMPGEVVVPTPLVRAGAVDHLRGMLPGFASGGLVGNLAAGTGHDVAAEARASLAAIVAAIKARIAAASPFAGITGVPSGGKISGSAAAAQRYAKSILWAYGWGQNQFPPLQALWNGESGWRWNALNPSSGAYGIPQSLPASKMASAGADWRTNPATQIRWGLGYIKNTPGYGSPGIVYAKWLSRSPHWYAHGGLVPGYATGGTVASRGRAWLNAWRNRSGGGFGAAWGPVVVNEQIARMSAAIGRASALASAKGLSAGQHRFWAAAAADERKRLAVLKSELTTERAWRYQLGLHELALDREIRAAGSLPSLAGPVRGWKAALARDKATVAAISKMLGYSGAYIKAHPAAPKLPPVQHVYGGDVSDVIAPILASALTPTVMDRGGWLRPGWNPPIWNGTSRPEAVIPSGRGAGGSGWDGTVQLEITGGDQELVTLLRKIVKVKGGGNVQAALGSRLCRPPSRTPRWA